jgi:hypothetical protein
MLLLLQVERYQLEIGSQERVLSPVSAHSSFHPFRHVRGQRSTPSHRSEAPQNDETQGRPTRRR